MVTVHIVMPTYRHADHIHDAAVSLQKQTMEDWQCAIVFDGERAGRERVPDDPRFTCIMEDVNQGTATALNTGFGLGMAMAADYWTWVSSDNVMAPHWLETMVECLETHPDAPLVFGYFTREKGSIRDGVWVPKESKGAFMQGSPLASGAKQFLGNYHGLGPAFLIRQEFAQTVGDYRGGTAQDSDWCFRAEEEWMRRGQLPRFIEEPCCTYRVHRDRQTVYWAGKRDGDHWVKEAHRRRGVAHGQALGD